MNELENYLERLNAAYDNAIENIKIQYSQGKNISAFRLLFDNNEPLLPYITDLNTGAGLKNEDDNLSAMKEAAKRHLDFMNFVYTIKST